MSDSNKREHITKRTRMWRSRNVKPALRKAIEVIEEHGFQVLHISADKVCPAFSYTTGVYDTFGKPELITVGLPASVAQHALNDAVSLMRDGTDLTVGRHRDLIANVEVEFRKVDSSWLHQVMLRTNWFYDGQDVPILQLVYPDLENRFQDEDDNFNEFFRQPVLTGEILEGTLAYDFWASHDEASSLSRWKFPDSPHASAYLSVTVNDMEEQVTYVSHDADGDWQFLGDRMSDGGGPVLTCLHHPIDHDRSLEELHDLPVNWYAERETPTSSWRRFARTTVESDHDEQSEPHDPSLLN